MSALAPKADIATNGCSVTSLDVLHFPQTLGHHGGLQELRVHDLANRMAVSTLCGASRSRQGSRDRGQRRQSRAIVESLERSLGNARRLSTITVVKTLAEAVRIGSPLRCTPMP